MRRRAVTPAPEDVFAEALSTLADPYLKDAMVKVDGGLNPGPQTDAFNSDAELVLFGGQAGGGKSRLLLMVARLKHRRSLLIRRSVPELRRDIVRQAFSMYGDPKCYNKNEFIWTFPDGVTVELGYCENDKDLLRYKGGEYDFIGLDEGSELTANQAYYFLSRLRSTVPGLKQQMIVATNPGLWPLDPWGPWLDLGIPPGSILYRKKDDDHLWITTNLDDEDAHSMTFFPARLSDNPYLGKEYRRRLNLLPEPYRSQLRDGDWTAGMTDEEHQVIPSDWVRAAVLRWRKWRAANAPLPARMTIAGCDIGRLRDPSVIALRYGYLVPELLRFFTDDTMKVVGYIGMVLTEKGGGAIIDVDGVGAGVYNRLAELNSAADNILPFPGGLSGSYTDMSGTLKILNLRAAAYWHMREILDPASGLSPGLPPDDRLFKGLTAPRWEPTSGGRIKLEEKDIIKNRIGFSPDEADAVVMSFWADMEGLTALEATAPYRFLDNLSHLGADRNRPHLLGRMR